MTKAEFIELFSEKHKVRKATMKRIYEDLVHEIKKSIFFGKNFTIFGLGTITPVTRKERTCINPQTKEQMQVPSKKTAKFVISKSFKDILNGKKKD